MSTTYRRAAPSIIERLLTRPQRFNFFQAVSLLLLHMKEQGVAPDKALIAHLRFENSLSLGFPSSDIEALRTELETALDAADAADAAAQAPANGSLRGIAMTPTFMGFLGLHGALPNHYTQCVADLQHATGDEGVRAFLDIFQTRIVALFYEAWRKYRVETTIGCDGDEFLPMLLSLPGLRAGVAAQAPESRGGLAAGSAGNGDGDGSIDTAVFAHHAGLLRQRPVSAATLARVLTDYFRVPIAARETVGYWDDLAPDEMWRHGAPGMVMGERTVLGTRMWRPDLRICLTIGPLTRAQFESFSPKTARIKALTQLLAVFGKLTLSYEIALMLRGQDLESLAFAAPGRRRQTIGHGIVLRTRPGKEDRVGMRFVVQALAPLPSGGSLSIASQA
ncbi:type VI secretion system baseplate subunit TssG [Massilia sp. DWR3-1-1]|uniref:type VI secretion system baseplate subunit TssG n=1 Tax=Massilia sp. DWR3-1-1 TaxID=2804559 RepID=UPI003CF1AF64